MASLTTILDMVKVMAFALQEGRVAVHCHAGLGRTGMCSTARSTELFFYKCKTISGYKLLIVCLDSIALQDVHL